MRGMRVDHRLHAELLGQLGVLMQLGAQRLHLVPIVRALAGPIPIAKLDHPDAGFRARRPRRLGGGIARGQRQPADGRQGHLQTGVLELPDKWHEVRANRFGRDGMAVPHGQVIAGQSRLAREGDQLVGAVGLEQFRETGQVHAIAPPSIGS